VALTRSGAPALPVGGVLGARYRFGEHLALGGFASLAWAGSASYASTQLRAGAQLRWWPLGARGPGLWLGPDAGLVQPWDRVDSEVLRHPARTHATAAAFGVSAGRSSGSELWYP